ncbi:MAG: hypothetical protein GY938_16955 [Ketobacter sp.]|nr:hypothetical protein [Ketobacter sp.]
MAQTQVLKNKISGERMRRAYRALKLVFISRGLMRHTRDALSFDRVMKRIEAGELVLVIKDGE